MPLRSPRPSGANGFMIHACFKAKGGSPQQRRLCYGEWELTDSLSNTNRGKPIKTRRARDEADSPHLRNRGDRSSGDLVRGTGTSLVRSRALHGLGHDLRDPRGHEGNTALCRGRGFPGSARSCPTRDHRRAFMGFLERPVRPVSAAARAPFWIKRVGPCGLNAHDSSARAIGSPPCSGWRTAGHPMSTDLLTHRSAGASVGLSSLSQGVHYVCLHHRSCLNGVAC